MNFRRTACLVVALMLPVRAADEKPPPRPHEPDIKGLPPEDDPALARFYGPLAPPPGTPVLDATDARALEAHLFRPVIVRCTVTGRRPQMENDAEPSVPVAVLKDSRLFLSTLVGGKIYRAVGIEGATPGSEGATPAAPRTIFVAGILEPGLLWNGHVNEVLPSLQIYSHTQVSDSAGGVRFSWVTRPWFAGEWKAPEWWYDLPQGMALDAGPAEGAARINAVVMRPDNGVAIVAPINACFTPAPDDGRIVIDSHDRALITAEGDPWSHRMHREITRHAAAGRKWPKGAELTLGPGCRCGSPWDAPDPATDAGAAILLDAMLNRLILRKDVAIAAGLGPDGKLVPAKLLAARIAAAMSAGINTIIVANAPEDAAVAAHILGAMTFTGIQVVAASTVSEAAVLASEASRASLAAAATRMQSLKSAPSPDGLLAILKRDAAVRELNAIAAGPPVNFSALMLKRAGRREVPLVALSSQGPGYALPFPVAATRLRELMSWDFHQFKSTKTVNGSLQTSSSDVSNPAFADANVLDIEALLPHLPPKLQPAGKTALAVATGTVAQEAAKKAAKRIDDSATEKLRERFEDQLAEAEGRKSRRRKDKDDGLVPEDK